MINIDKFIADEQDIKVVEKVLPKLVDLLASTEELLYLAVQKRPAVNLLPTCIALSDKRIFYCEPGNLGLTTNFKDIAWRNIKEVSFKEEFFGSKFICVPLHGENLVTEYIPKNQARKLYQMSTEQLENLNLGKGSKSSFFQEVEEAQIVSDPILPAIDTSEEDETTLKLRKLKSLYDKQLITLAEYEMKKASLLDEL